jgi:hypothetical protein
VGHSALRSLLLAFAATLAVAASASAHEVETHGDPREALPDSLVTQPVAQAEAGSVEPSTPASATGLPEAWCGTETTTDDTADAAYPSTTPQLKLIYAYAADQPNRFAEFDDRLQATASLLGRFVAQQSGGRKTLRWDLGTPCGRDYADIQVVRLPKARAEYVVNGAPQFSLVRTDVRAVVIGQGGPRNWVVYADGLYGTNGVAGTASLIETDNGAYHDAGRLFAAVFGPQTPPANGYAWPSVMLHEIAHNLGAVQRSAPHTTMAGHCNDRYDVMCYADGGANATMTYPCPKIAGLVDETFDCGGDDYFNASPAPDSHLDRDWNLFRSAHLATCTSDAAACDGTAVDATPPIDTTPAKVDPPPTNTPYTVELSGTDSESVVDAYAWKVDAGAVQYGQTATVTHGYQLFTRVRDAAGNWSRWKAQIVNVDTQGPVVELTCPAETVRARSLLCRTYPSYDAVALEAQVGDGPIRTYDPASYPEILVEEDGDTVVRARATDYLGNVGEWEEVTAHLDRDVPWVTVDCPPETRAEPIDCTVTGGDGDEPPASLRWRIDGGTEYDATSPATVTVSSQGAHAVRATVVGASGETVTAYANVRLDLTPPTASLSCGGNGAWLYGRASCTVTASDPDTGAYRPRFSIDDGPFASTSGFSFFVTVDGEHSVRAQVENGAGTVVTTAPVTVRVDATKPAVTVACPEGWVAAASLSCDLGGSDAHTGIAGFSWMLATDTSSRSLTGATGRITVTREGTSEVVAVARDGVGNSSDAVRRTVKLDGTDPSVAVACPDGWAEGPATCTVTASDAVSGLDSLSWRVDGGEPQSGPSGSQVTISSPGRHTIVATAQDRAGRVATASSELPIDPTPPVARVDCPDGWQAAAVDCALSFSDPESGVAVRRVRVDGNAPVEAGESVRFSAEGEHLAEAEAVNGAGVASGWSGDTARLDFTKPDGWVVCPFVWSTTGPVTCEAHGSDARSGVVGYDYEIAGSPAASLVVTLEGRTTVRARARDAAGNVGEWRSAVALIDRIDPVVDLDCGPSGWRPGPVDCSVDATDAGARMSLVSWLVDDDRTTFAAPPSSFTVSSNGPHVVRASAEDAAGRTASETATFSIDGSVPVASAACPSGWQAGAVTCSLSFADPESGIASRQVRVDGGAVTGAGDTVTVSGQGRHTVEVRAVNGAGASSEWRASIVQIDTTAPTVTLDCPGWTDAASVTCSATATDQGGSGVAEVERDGLVVTAEGVTTVRSRARDAAGNLSEYATAMARIDRTDPLAEVDCPGGWHSGPVTCRVGGVDEGSGVSSLSWRVDGGDEQTGEVIVGGHGRHTIAATAVDGVGRSATSSAEALIDLADPVATLGCEAGEGTTHHCTPTAADEGSGLASVRLLRDGNDAGPVAPGEPFDVEAPAEIAIVATDGAGRTTTTEPITLNAPPAGDLPPRDPPPSDPPPSDPPASEDPPPSQGEPPPPPSSDPDPSDPPSSDPPPTTGPSEDEPAPPTDEPPVSPGDSVDPSDESPVSPGDSGVPSDAPSSDGDEGGGPATTPDEPSADADEGPSPATTPDEPSADADVGGDPATTSGDASAVGGAVGGVGSIEPDVRVAGEPVATEPPAIVRTAAGRALATAAVAPLQDGRAAVRVVPAKLAAGTWRIRVCAGERCASRSMKLRRARRPRPLTANLRAKPGQRVTFVLQRRDARGRFRTVARGAARIV